MPLRDGITVGDAREEVSNFLAENGCYDICANCPTYGEDGCCRGCDHLKQGEGCSRRNLSCLAYTCGILNMHLSRRESQQHGDQLSALTDMLYGLPREGYRGCEPRDEREQLQIEDPLEIRASVSQVVTSTVREAWRMFRVRGKLEKEE